MRGWEKGATEKFVEKEGIKGRYPNRGRAHCRVVWSGWGKKGVQREKGWVGRWHRVAM